MEQRALETPHGTIAYWTSWAAGRAPLLVFLPGLTADHHLFDPQLSAFEGRFNLIAWDAPRHGASRPFGGTFSFDELARLIHDIVEREIAEAGYGEDGQRPQTTRNRNRPLVVLAGQSLGGYIAQAYTDLFPREVDGIAAIDSAPLKRSYYASWEIAALKHTYWMYRAFPFRLLAKAGAAGCATTAAGRAYMESIVLSFEKKEYCQLAHDGYRALAQAVEADRAYEMPCPTLIICGSKDRAGSTKRYSTRWSERENLPIVWIPDAGHNSTIDNPQAVNASLAAFVEKLAAERRPSHSS